jgi:hypothetical protein
VSGYKSENKANVCLVLRIHNKTNVTSHMIKRKPFNMKSEMINNLKEKSRLECARVCLSITLACSIFFICIILICSILCFYNIYMFYAFMF